MLPDLHPTISGFINAAADTDEQGRIAEALYQIVTQHRRMATRARAKQPADKETTEIDYWDCTVTVEDPFQRERGASLRAHCFRRDSKGVARVPPDRIHLQSDKTFCIKSRLTAQGLCAVCHVYCHSTATLPVI